LIDETALRHEFFLKDTYCTAQDTGLFMSQSNIEKIKHSAIFM